MANFRAFLEGLFRPSGLAVGVALAVSVGLLAAAFVIINEDFVRSPSLSAYLRANGRDDDVTVTSALLSLPQRDPERPVVVIVGASDVRSVINRPQFVKAVDEGNEGQIDVEFLTQQLQSFWETRRIVRALPRGAKGVFVLGINIGLFARGKDLLTQRAKEPRLGIRDPEWDAMLAEEGLNVETPTGNFLWDNRQFYVPRLQLRLLWSLMRGPHSTDIYPYDDLGPVPRSEWERQGKAITGRFEQMSLSFDTNVARLAEICDELRVRTRMRILVLNLPYNPRFVSDFLGQDRYRAESERVSATLDRLGLREVDLTTVGLCEQDYWDSVHLSSPETRSRITTLVAAEVRSLLSAERSPP